MKIVYCGFDLFKDCLEELIEAGHEILAVYSFPTDNKHDFHDYVLKFAQKHKIKFVIGPVTEDDLGRFADNGCDAIISAGYAYKIPVCERIPYRLNVHPAPLPYGRGAWPIACAIREGVREWAVTIHELSAEWDEGPILAQKKFAVSVDEKLESLSVKCQMVAQSLLGEVIRDIEAFWKNRVAQGSGVYWKMPTSSERMIDWKWSIEEIDRHVRAFGKHGARAIVDGNNIFVYDVIVWQEIHKISPGDIVWRTNDEIVVAAPDGLVCIRFWEKISE